MNQPTGIRMGATVSRRATAARSRRAKNTLVDRFFLKGEQAGPRVRNGVAAPAQESFLDGRTSTRSPGAGVPNTSATLVSEYPG